MSKHTPGPWKPGYIADSGTTQIVWQSVGSSGFSVCSVGKYQHRYEIGRGASGHREVPHDEVVANVNLIAAAPDLLEFAVRIMRDHRATLPSETRDLFGGGCGCPQCEVARRLIAKAEGRA